MSVSSKRLCVLAVLHTAPLGPPRLYAVGKRRDLAGAATKKAAVGRRLWQREVGEEERWPAADEGGEEGSNGKGTVLPRAGRWEMRRRRQRRLMWERIRR
ncbi:hypothetical protein B296_00042754 [Ensete ventricosum]|uniref:Uncharacterized protein n=1 Tax=Ensete ventricosum TaxID=4639 RepID=A0A426XAW3_ENSVE|nr:hypothetical protein B296_00042754 [Ensete ventricosum]